MTKAVAPYPRELERSLRLRDGTAVRIRPIRPEDAERLIELYSHLSRQTAYQRFFTVMQRLPPDWAKMLATVDYQRRLALIAEAETASSVEPIGVARFEPTDRPDTAEVAFVVQDGWQGKGLGSMVMADLLRAAEARGIRRFCAWVLADNRRMLRLIARHGEIEERKFDSGVLEIVFRRRELRMLAGASETESAGAEAHMSERV